MGVVALNGIPFVGEPPTYFGVPVTPAVVQEQFLLSLGLGAVLTFMNQGNAPLELLGRISRSNGHDWALHGTAVTLCFAGAPTFVEMSFARDGRFHLSWVEPRGSTDWNAPRVFTAAASLKVWRKYLANMYSPEFLATQRRWLAQAHDEICGLFPRYFLDSEPLEIP